MDAEILDPDFVLMIWLGKSPCPQMLTRCLLPLHQNTTEFIKQNHEADPNHILVQDIIGEVIQVNRMRNFCLDLLVPFYIW